MEKFYPRIAQFARGEGYPCGNKGVFIPRRNKCWTHPKTGQRMRKPLTYQLYQDAKEKSQRSKTEKGRTALANREQSFRDKAREKVKGWQNKAKEGEKVEVRGKRSSRPRMGTKEYDNWLENEASNLKGQVSTFDIKTKKGKDSVEGFVVNGLGVHENKGSLFLTHGVTHVKSGISVGDFDNEEQAKKAVVELQRSNIDWNAEDLTKIPGIRNKLQGIVNTVEQVKSSDLRLKNARKNAVRLEKSKIEQSKLDADMERYKKEEAKRIEQSKAERRDQLAKEKAERDRIDAMMRDKKIAEIKARAAYEVNSATNSIDSNLNPDTWRARMDISEEKLRKHKEVMEKTGSRKNGGLSREEEKNVKEYIELIKTRSEFLDNFLDKDDVDLENLPGTLKDPIRKLFDYGKSSEEIKGIIKSTHQKYKKKKKDFNSHLNITEFGKPGCCCDASKPLRRRKTKQTPRLKRRGTRYA